MQSPRELNVDSWAFLVLPTRVLDGRVGGQKTIGLLSLRALEPIETDFSGLAAAVERAYSI